jgi:hypothetical protein
MIENIQIHMSRQVFFFCLKIFTNVKNNMKMKYFIIFCLKRKVIRFLKIDNHVATFPYWFKLLERTWKQARNQTLKVHENETIVLINKNTKVVCFKYYNHKIMACNI